MSTSNNKIELKYKRETCIETKKGLSDLSLSFRICKSCKIFSKIGSELSEACIVISEISQKLRKKIHKKG